MRKEYFDTIKNIVSNYEEFKRIAVPLKWAETETAYCDASQYFREVYLYFYSVKFPKGYVQNNFPAAFVQTMLTAMGISEEWENDFWGSMSVQERSYVLTKAEQFYKEYICYERVCLQEMTAAEFQKDVRSWFPWARTKEEMSEKFAYILPEAAKNMFAEFSQAEAIWLGGVANQCVPDENWLAVQDDAMLHVSFHCSG